MPIFKERFLDKNINVIRDRNYQIESAMRSKKTIRDYALCNDWDYFYTITLDKKNVKDRTSVETNLNKLLKFFDNFKQRKGKDLKYIIVIEHHKKLEKNGKHAIHFHGLIKLSENFKKNNPLNFPVKVDGSFKLKSYIDKYDNKIFYTESPLIRKSFGMNTFTAIYNSHEFLSYYISKYITKMDLTELETKQRFYKSQLLNKPELTNYDDLDDIVLDFTYRFIRKGVEPVYINNWCEKYKFTKDQWGFIESQIGDNLELW